MAIIIEFGDVEANDRFVNRRLAIGVSLFILYLVHFGFQFLAYISTGEKIVKHKIDHLSKRIYLLGIAQLLSYNYLQGGTFEATLAWITLILAITLHMTTLKTFDNLKLENRLWIAYYTLLWIFYLGIIISFYSN